MKTLNLNDLLKEWEQDCIIDDKNLDEESKKTMRLHSKYLAKLQNHQIKLKYQISQVDILKKDLWLYYHGKLTKDQMDQKGWDYDPLGGIKIIKSDVNQFIETDFHFVEENTKCEYLKNIVDTLERIMNNIQWRHTHIKNIIEWKKFVSGA